MNLTEDLKRILQAIDKGPGSLKSVSSLTDLASKRVNDYMDDLEKEGYIKGHKTYPTDKVGLCEYSSSRLTGKGRVALEQQMSTHVKN